MFVTDGFLADGSLVLAYGDWDTNTGLIDVISVSPAGVVTTRFEDFDTEAIGGWRTFDDGSTWAPALDPRTNGIALAVTNQGGTWHTVQVRVPGVENAIHVFDLDQEPDGTLLACGSHSPDNAYVWESTDLGATWTVGLSHPGVGTNGFNRFYRIERDAQGRAMVQRVDADGGHFVRINGVWTSVAGAAPKVRQGPVHIETDGRLTHTTRGTLLTLPDDYLTWSAAEAPDGAVWFSNRTTLFRLPPPD